MIERWEYLILVRLRSSDNSSAGLKIFHPGGAPDDDVRETDTLSEVLNEFGSQGWELVTSDVIGSIAFPASAVQEVSGGTASLPARFYAQDRALILKRRIEP